MSFHRHASAVIVGAAALVIALATGAVRHAGNDGNDGNHGNDVNDVTAATRTRVDIGDDVVAVLDPGARLSWHEDVGLRGPRVVVEQRAGRVLYRVKAHGADIRAPADARASCAARCAFVVDGAAVAAIDGDVAVDARATALARDDDDNDLASIDDDSPGARRNLEKALADMRELRARLRN